ncbi:GGDEF domain-containing protein [Methylobacterium sp. ID0610]|uniref:GGDEF domain-containing protein n=1 Tax=Methylobacterium carpenticola TaxID=3344827 RepID=UPI0036A8717C
MLLLTLVIALITAGFLALEWRVVRDQALPFWSAGFAVIVLGCSMSPLRQSFSFYLGVWAANGLLVIAHLLFLFGVGRFVGRRLSPLWWGLLLPWMLLVAVPADASVTRIFGVLNSVLVAIVASATGLLLLRAPGPCKTSASNRLAYTFLGHGAFYGLKTCLVFLPGAFVSLIGFKGLLIQLSLLEGIVVEVLLALLMAASVRRRREDRIAALAEQDPLTGVLNRRAFEERAARLLRAAEPHGGALLLLDVDHFKAVNDTFGHRSGDHTLVALAAALTATLPSGALVARLGGDEFAALLTEAASADVERVGSALRARFAAVQDARTLPLATATISIGAAIFGPGETGLGPLLEVADAALYEAKRQGRDRLRWRRADPPRAPGPGAGGPSRSSSIRATC